MHSSILFFFTDTATTEIYTLSLHDALPISYICGFGSAFSPSFLTSPTIPTIVLHGAVCESSRLMRLPRDRKSTRLNSSHLGISYAVFCLKKKTQKIRYAQSEQKAAVQPAYD